MSATTSELLDSYTKMLDSEFYKNLKGIIAGIEALQNHFQEVIYISRCKHGKLY